MLRHIFALCTKIARLVLNRTFKFVRKAANNHCINDRAVFYDINGNLISLINPFGSLYALLYDRDTLNGENCKNKTR